MGALRTVAYPFSAHPVQMVATRQPQDGEHFIRPGGPGRRDRLRPSQALAHYGHVYEIGPDIDRLAVVSLRYSSFYLEALPAEQLLSLPSDLFC